MSIGKMASVTKRENASGSLSMKLLIASTTLLQTSSHLRGLNSVSEVYPRMMRYTAASSCVRSKCDQRKPFSFYPSANPSRCMLKGRHFLPSNDTTAKQVFVLAGKHEISSHCSNHDHTKDCIIFVSGRKRIAIVRVGVGILECQSFNVEVIAHCSVHDGLWQGHGSRCSHGERHAHCRG